MVLFASALKKQLVVAVENTCRENNRWGSHLFWETENWDEMKERKEERKGSNKQMLCISASFWVLRAPKSWSNYFFSAVFNLFCSCQSFFSDLTAEINKKRLKMNKKRGFVYSSKLVNMQKLVDSLRGYPKIVFFQLIFWKNDNFLNFLIKLSFMWFLFFILQAPIASRENYFFWKYQILDTEPYLYQNRGQTRHARGPVHESSVSCIHFLGSKKYYLVLRFFAF